MSQSKVLGGAGMATAIASLPVTGSATLTLAAVGVSLLVGGLLMVRAARFQRYEI
jgi:LPXTG-motif cell wall-anchored protein